MEFRSLLCWIPVFIHFIFRFIVFRFARFRFAGSMLLSGSCISRACISLPRFPGCMDFRLQLQYISLQCFTGFRFPGFRFPGFRISVPWISGYPGFQGLRFPGIRIPVPRTPHVVSGFQETNVRFAPLKPLLFGISLLTRRSTV